MTNQLDYIFFVYGLAFLLLAVMVSGRPRHDDDPLPWNALAWFGLLHGMNEWFDLFAFSLGDPQSFKCFRLIYIAGSFIPLLEFGLTGLQRQGMRLNKRFIYVPLLIIASLGAIEGLPGLNASLRYALGFPGALSAALVLYRQSRYSPPRRTYCLIAVPFLVYSIATGVIVPRAEYFPASILNQEAFLAFTGFPIQLIRALCAATAALGVWLTCCKHSPAEDTRLSRWLIPSLLAALLAGGFLARPLEG